MSSNYARVLASRLMTLFTKRRRDEELDDEIQAHLDLLAKEQLRTGMSPKDAQAAARRQFGGVEQVKEQYRAQRGLPMIDELWQDLRYAIRTLRRSPGFTLVAAGSLAIGIGLNTALFTFVDALLFAPFLRTVEQPDRLVDVFTTGIDGSRYMTSSYPDYVDFKTRTVVFTDILAYTPSAVAMKIGGQSSRMALGEIVTGNYFQILGVGAALGRPLAPPDDRPGATRVVMISQRLWRREFASSSNALGQTIRIHGQPYTIVGIVPEGFVGMTPVLTPDVWTPMVWAEDVDAIGISESVPSPGITELEQRGRRWLFLKGRLKPDVTRERAGANLNAVMQQLAREYPDTNKDRRVDVLSTKDVRVHPSADRIVRPVAAGLTMVVGLVLLVACANITSMLLARASGRQKEIGVRLALGASRGRLVRQLLTESVVLSSVGAFGGLAFAWALLRLLAAVRVPASVPLTFEAHLGVHVFWFTAAIATIAGLVAGLAPALRATRRGLLSELRGIAVTATMAGRRWTLRDGLVALQMAASLVLLVAAALLIRSMVAAQKVNVGFGTDGIASVTTALDVAGYKGDKAEFLDRAVARIRALPGVESAALVRRLPLDLSFTPEVIVLPDRNMVAGISTETTVVSPDYFSTLGVRILDGRNFTSADMPTSPRVAIVNKVMAEMYWPHQGAIGKHFRLRSLDGPDYEVVGVSADYKVRAVAEPPTPYIHYARSQQPSRANVVVARTRGDASALVALMRRELLALEPDLVFPSSQTLQRNVDTTLLPARLAAAILSAVGVIAVGLASAGLFGVIAYTVTLRAREIGIRMALGARSSDVIGDVMRHGLTLALAGALLGAVLASGAARLMSRVLYHVSAGDPIAWAAAIIALFSASVLANVVPARRASRVDPMVALRCE